MHLPYFSQDLDLNKNVVGTSAHVWWRVVHKCMRDKASNIMQKSGSLTLHSSKSTNPHPHAVPTPPTPTPKPNHLRTIET